MFERLFVVSKRFFKGKFVTPDKKEADDLLEPGTVVDVYDNGELYGSYGCVLATEVDPGKQIENKQGQIGGSRELLRGPSN